MSTTQDAAETGALHSPWLGLRLVNFRTFDDTERLRFAPITVVFGRNSSGKTTLLRAPLLLRQAIDTPPQAREVPFTGSEVDFGAYRDVVHKGELSRDVTLEVDIAPKDLADMLFLEPDARPKELEFMEGGVRLTVVFHWNMRDSRSQTQSVRFRALGTDEPVAVLTREGPTTTRVELPQSDMRRTVRNGPELSLPSMPLIARGFTHSRRQLIELDFVFYVIHNVLRELTRSYVHIGPLRDMPARAYRMEQTASAGTSSMDIVRLLSRERPALTRVSKALQKLGMARSIEVTRPAPGFAGVVLTETDTGRKRNLADVGFGVSQILPVLARIATAPARSMVAIEQPELHLHPHAQGELASTLVGLARQSGVDLLIESHSEHILLRLQRLVAEGTLSPGDVAVYVVAGGTVSKASIDELGRLDSGAFPEDFFEEEWLDAVAVARSAAKKMASLSAK